ncbi:MAG: hypothetical protein ACLQSR_04690, partial [Limisphaerales bacterium]
MSRLQIGAPARWVRFGIAAKARTSAHGNALIRFNLFEFASRPSRKNTQIRANSRKRGWLRRVVEKQGDLKTPKDALKCLKRFIAPGEKPRKRSIKCCFWPLSLLPAVRDCRTPAPV